MKTPLFLCVLCGCAKPPVDCGKSLFFSLGVLGVMAVKILAFPFASLRLRVKNTLAFLCVLCGCAKPPVDCGKNAFIFAFSAAHSFAAAATTTRQP